ncbi:MAG: hypothetical protein IPM81_05615 [Saprospirales bacterium]|nr:hypothetical protein [Saprospirales bacterium]
MRSYVPFLLLTCCAAAWVFTVQKDPFFWDAVQLGSKHAHHFYQNSLQWTPLPADIDSGHPPVFGYYLALAWALFGKTLPVSHWAMLPFVAGFAALAFQLGKRLTNPAQAWWLVAMVCLDPVWAGQSALVGPDITLACFFLLALEGLTGGRGSLTALGVFGLCAVSMRGMMTAGALLVWQFFILLPGNHPGRRLVATGLLFLPGLAFAFWFLAWHYRHTGWIGFHANSPWAPSFEPARSPDFIKNILVTGWRWLDFGRIVEWGVLFLLLAQNRFKLPDHNNHQWRQIAWLVVFLMIFLTPSALLYRNLSAHRYFLPGFVALHILVFLWLSTGQTARNLKTGLLVITALGLATGNRWIYPQGISMGWDATLAHRPYHRLRADMIAFIDREKIDWDSIGTAFPNINTGEILLLNGDQRKMTEKNAGQNRYILASNIFNDFTTAEYALLERQWILLRRQEQSGVWMALYQRKN